MPVAAQRFISRERRAGRNRISIGGSVRYRPASAIKSSLASSLRADGVRRFMATRHRGGKIIEASAANEIASLRVKSATRQTLGARIGNVWRYCVRGR